MILLTSLFMTNFILLALVYIIVGMMTVNVLTTTPNRFLTDAQVELLAKGSFYVVCFWPFIWLLILFNVVNYYYQWLKDRL